MRLQFKPKGKIRAVFLGESPPESRGEIRFFYGQNLSSHDNLFRGLMLALYNADKFDLDRTAKAEWLQRFRDDGFYLEDLCEEPVNGLPERERSNKRRIAVAKAVTRLQRLKPEGIVICHAKVFGDAYEQLRLAGLPVLHDRAIPFPLGNWRADFVAAVRKALASLP